MQGIFYEQGGDAGVSRIRPYRFPETLRKTMKEREASGADIRRETGISEMLVSLYIHGKSVPSAYNLFRLANYLDVTTDYLLTGEEEKEWTKCR